MSACRRMPNLPAAPLANKKKLSSISHHHHIHCHDSTSPQCGTGSHHFRLPSSISETEDGEQVDVDGVAVKDVDTGQDVLNEKPSMSALILLQKARNWSLTRRPAVLQVYFSFSAAPSQPYFHLPPWYWHLMGAAVRVSNSAAGAAAALATVAATRKILENCMFDDRGFGRGSCLFGWICCVE